MPTSESSEPGNARLAWLGPSVVAGLVCVVLSLLCTLRHEPRLPRVIELHFEPARNAAGHAEPLLTLGRVNSGDFLFARFIDETRVVLGYDSWGLPRLETQPVTLTPGQRHRLRVTLPLANPLPDKTGTESTGRLRIELDGQSLLEGPAHYFTPATTAEIYVGTNPLGGTAAAPQLRGALFRPDGTPVRTFGDLFSFFGRAHAVLAQAPGKLLVVLVLSAFAGWCVRRSLRVRQPNSAALSLRQRTLNLLRVHRVFVVCATVCATVFAGVITFGTFALTTAENFGTFYDYQAVSLLEGHWAVPTAALENEAFVVAGKNYGYFGPTPALVRLPWATLGFGFGHLSRSLMLGYYIAALAASYLLFRLARRLITTPSASLGASPSFVESAFLLSIGLGSTLLFLGSRAYVYHEAILCGAACALWSCWFSLRLWETGGARGWRGALVFGLLALHARPPAGLFALGVLGWSCVLLALRAPRSGKALRRYAALGLLCVLGVLSFNTISYLKFRTFDGAPLRFNLLYTPERIAHIEGKNFHLVNIPRNASTYFVWLGIRRESRFPYFFPGDRLPLEGFPNAKIDLAEPLAGLPCTMPGLVGLSLVSLGAFTFRRDLRGPLAAIILGLLPMALALFAAIATSQRYVADFCAAFIALAAFGLAWVESARRALRIAAVALFAVATAWAIVFNSAITFHYQLDILWGVPAEAKARYTKIRTRADAFFGLPAPATTPPAPTP